MSRVAAVQMASGPNVSANLIEAERMIGVAADDGAELVVLPENFAFMPNTDKDMLKIRETDGKGPIQDFLADISARLKIWIVGGTIPMKCDRDDKVRAACLVYGKHGKRKARYDKIHLFDVELVESKESYNESKTIESGDQTVTIDTPVGKLGLAICYDLRFPELFRKLVDQGAEIIAVPSAFTALTGRAHWEVLVRARAIENLSYVVAAAQGGFHINGRETHGDSMIVDCWGNVLDRLPRGSGVVVADFDRKYLTSVRKHFPAIKHRRI